MRQPFSLGLSSSHSSDTSFINLEEYFSSLYNPIYISILSQCGDKNNIVKNKKMLYYGKSGIQIQTRGQFEYHFEYDPLR